MRATDDLGGTGAATATVNVRTCEPAVSQTLRQLAATLGLEPTVRQLNCDLLEPLGLQLRGPGRAGPPGRRRLLG